MKNQSFHDMVMAIYELSIFNDKSLRQRRTERRSIALLAYKRTFTNLN
jgi:hypothetical protein